MDSEVVHNEITHGNGNTKSFRSCVRLVLRKLKQLKGTKDVLVDVSVDYKARIDRTTGQLIVHTQELQAVIESFHTDLHSMNRKQKIGQFVVNMLGTVFMKSLRFQLPPPVAFAVEMATHFVFGGIIASGARYMLHGSSGNSENYKAIVSPLEAEVKDRDETVDHEESLYSDCAKLLEILKELYCDPPDELDESSWEKVPTPQECIEWPELLTPTSSSESTTASSATLAKKLDSLNEKEYEILEPNVGDMISISAIADALKEVKQFMSVFEFYTLVWAWKYEDVTGKTMTRMIDDLHKKVEAFKQLQSSLAKVQIFKEKVCDTEKTDKVTDSNKSVESEAVNEDNAKL